MLIRATWLSCLQYGGRLPRRLSPKAINTPDGSVKRPMDRGHCRIANAAGHHPSESCRLPQTAFPGSLTGAVLDLPATTGLGHD